MRQKNTFYWEYGTCRDKEARRHKGTKNVQFVLWKAGEQGHKEDYWHSFDSSWWHEFVPYPPEPPADRYQKKDRILGIVTDILVGVALLVLFIHLILTFIKHHP